MQKCTTIGRPLRLDFVTPTIDHISSSSNSPTSPTTAKQKQARRTNYPARRTEYLQRIPVTVIDYVTPTIDHISSSSNSPTSPTAQPPAARRTVSAEPTAPRRTARRVLVQADSDVTAGGPRSAQVSSLAIRGRRVNTRLDGLLELTAQHRAATRDANVSTRPDRPLRQTARDTEHPDAEATQQRSVCGGGCGGAECGCGCGPAAAVELRPTSPPADVATIAHVTRPARRKSITMFTIAGHHFRKVARFSKDDRCRYCAKPMDAFVAEGHKCTDCKQLFHLKCIQNGGVVQVPCRVTSSTHVSVAARRKLRKRSAARQGGAAPSLPPGAAPASSHHHHHAQFSLTGTSEFTDRTDKIISDVRELQKMQDFITKKV
ncbi:hypothetical protein LSTR_LSTR015142 [Laodelphax striatellus]|uniref:Phorbol-ester/DAG-type domain-containing protein n=1 Tax=Laodelphax striatellus TaxID=195883 RepID=A0A482XRJ8_LAOST|nr:hypothetical protein LSTR_LSTR015142 [Laodelphax striatellus]